MAKDIIALMPPRCKHPNNPDASDYGWLHYVEPYAGGLAVLLANNPEGISEVVNDLNGDLTVFWRVLSSGTHFPDFLRRLQATPFSQSEWESSPHTELHHGSGSLYLSAEERAAHFFIRVRQSLSGRQDSFAGISRTRTRKGMNEQVSAWLNAVEGLPAVHARLKRVLVLNKPALEVIASEDGPRTLFYLDPPYLHETRTTTKEYGEFEMDDKAHGALLEALAGIKGRFLLSGYRSKLYDRVAELAKWNRHEFDLPNNSAGGKEKQRRIECVWTNY